MLRYISQFYIYLLKISQLKWKKKMVGRQEVQKFTQNSWAEVSLVMHTTWLNLIPMVSLYSVYLHSFSKNYRQFICFFVWNLPIDYLFWILKSGTGIALCIEKALAQSGVAREDVNYINAHATSTPSGDLNEYEAIIRCFGNNSEVKVIKFNEF